MSKEEAEKVKQQYINEQKEEMEKVKNESMQEVREKKEELKKTEERLIQREKDIIKMRYGIEYDKEMTLVEVGKEYELTSERVRQIQAKGEQKLKKYMIKKGFEINA